MALPEIANPTIAQLHEIINENIANDVEGGIDPNDDRSERHSVVNYLANIASATLKSKVVVLNTFAADRNYSIPTGISDGTNIHSVVVSLICKVTTDGFAIGDIVMPATPSIIDSGRIPGHGIGYEYTNANITAVRCVIEDQIFIMDKYNAAGGAIGSSHAINPSKWSIRLSILYV